MPELADCVNADVIGFDQGEWEDVGWGDLKARRMEAPFRLSTPAGEPALYDEGSVLYVQEGTGHRFALGAGQVAADLSISKSDVPDYVDLDAEPAETDPRLQPATEGTNVETVQHPSQTAHDGRSTFTTEEQLETQGGSETETLGEQGVAGDAPMPGSPSSPETTRPYPDEHDAPEVVVPEGSDTARAAESDQEPSEGGEASSVDPAADPSAVAVAASHEPGPPDPVADPDGDPSAYSNSASDAPAPDETGLPATKKGARRRRGET